MSQYIERSTFGQIFEGTPCIVWTGATTGKGHGRITLNRRRVLLHRHSFEVFHKRSIRSGFVVHHKCEIRLCFNPLHLMEEPNFDHNSRHHKCIHGDQDRNHFGQCRICHNIWQRNNYTKRWRDK